MIKARIRPENPEANLKSYVETCNGFKWETIFDEFTVNEAGEIDIVYECIDKWAKDPVTQDNPALVFEKNGSAKTFSFRDLSRQSAKWAHLLHKYSYKPGDRVFIYLPNSPEIYFAMLACARLGVMYSVLYPTLGTDELEWRMSDAEPRGVFTNQDFAPRLPRRAMDSVQHVFYVEGQRLGLFAGETELSTVSQHMSEEFEMRFFAKDTPLYLIFTSGSTGPPKGVVHAHRDIAGLLMTARFALDLTPGSVLWTDADPSWVTGAIYGSYAPWLCGVCSVIQGDSFSSSTWYGALERHKVTHWYTTPGVIKKLMDVGGAALAGYDLSRLRHVATVGELLNPDLLYWAKEHLKLVPHDTWWMTETGMICMANFPSQTIKPGSMGKPVPGVEARVIDHLGEILPFLTLGELAIKPDWPNFMLGIWKDQARTAEYFRDGWFLTGDMVIKDEDGYYFHMGRNDDLIKIGPELLGPYDFEQILKRHEAVAETAVISKSPVPGEVVIKAFVRPADGVSPSDELRKKLILFLTTNFHCELPLVELDFLEEIPKTRSGKLVRRALRVRELGLPFGDPQHLEDSHK